MLFQPSAETHPPPHVLPFQNLSPKDIAGTSWKLYDAYKRLKDKNECFLYIQILLYAMWLIHMMEPNWQKDWAQEM